MKARALILVFVALAALALAGAYAWRTTREHEVEQTVAIGGPFQLTDQNGRAVDESVLEGKWSAVFFGFTNCPDVCHGTLQALDVAAGQLGPKAKDFQIVFVGVDSRRDTPAQMKAYMEAQSLSAPAIGLTGTPGQIAAVAQTYRAYYAIEGEGDETAVSHSNAIYLMDPKGRFVTPLHYDLPPDQLAGEIREAMG
jgi:protein SCO1/2